MRIETITNTYNIYTFEELSEAAKDRVRQDFINDPCRARAFYDMTLEELGEAFPDSKLDVEFDLSYCQGDGLNIIGTLALADFLPFFNCTEKEKRTLEFYFKYFNTFEFTNNNRYGYSCKFIDLKDVNYTVEESIEALAEDYISGINEDLIKRFYTSMLTYFDELDCKFEKTGYSYLYYEDDEDLKIEASNYEFLEDGTIYN